MKKLLTGLFTLSTAFAFICGSALSAEKPNNKVILTPSKIDNTISEPNTKKFKSTDVKVKTEKNASQKTDKALGEGVGPIPPPIGPGGPIGKSTSTNAGK